MSANNQDYADTDIAIVGMAGRFAGAQDVEEYWRNLRDGVEALTQLTDEQLEAAGVDRRTRTDPNYIKSSFLLRDMEMFDATFFGLSPKEGAIMDPQHRVFLETAWAATEHAGHAPENFSGRIGVFAGCGMNNYLIHNLISNPKLVRSEGMFLLRHTGNDKDFLATRVSYAMNLTGPSINVQTACSTSLVAIHVACQSLLNGECDMALAGGSTIRQPQHAGYLYDEGGVVSPDGHCRAFDAEAAGTVFGSGTGVVVLRRLKDALAAGDTIHAVIKGSAINNDGSAKVGYLAPSVDRQAEAIAEAIAISNVEARSISYIETHGTGTPVGDPIEITAMTEAFRRETGETGFCAIGSVKTNIGHVDTAAGVASVIKVTQALKHREIPASLNFSAPNPAIDFGSSPFYVNAQLQPWESEGPRRAGVNALGVGGTNAHVILQEAPAQSSAPPARATQLFVLSAKTAPALERAAHNLANFLRANPGTNLGDAAHTLQVGRSALRQRRVVAGSSVQDIIAALETSDARRMVAGEAVQGEPSLAFMFSGGGAQYAGMGADLYRTEPVFRQEADRCFAILSKLIDYDPKELLYPAGDVEAAGQLLEQPSRALPALFITQYALARLLMSWGLSPDAMIGHSMGEYTAAHLAGVFSLEDAIALVTLRGRLFEQVPEGGMLSVNLPVEQVLPLLGSELSIAAVNAPELCVASGPTHAINALQEKLEAMEVECQRVRISIAAHSSMLEPILAEFGAFFRRIKLNAPTLPYASNVSGTWITAEEATNPDYWVRHLRHTVKFAEGVAHLLEQPNRSLVEVGPGRTLTTLARLSASFGAGHAAVQTMRHPGEVRSDVEYLLESLGRIWVHGKAIDWSKLHEGDQRRRIPLPTYSFERQRCWVEPGKREDLLDDDTKPEKRPDVGEWFFQASWKRTTPVAASVNAGERFLILRAGLPFADVLCQQLRARGHTVIEVNVGAAFARTGDDVFELNPARAADYDALFDTLAQNGTLPRRILHLWNVGAEPSAGDALAGLEDAQTLAFFSLLYLAQAIGRADLSDPLALSVVTNNMQSVAGEAWLAPVKSLAIGPCRIIRQEFPNIDCRSVDVVLPRAGSWQEERLVEQLIGEVSAERTDTVVAYRGTDRWAEAFEPVALHKPAAHTVKSGSTVLITGGLGGIALEVAEHLARTASANVALVARTKLPARSEWATWIQSRGEGDRTSRRIRKIEQIERLGGRVLTVHADVTNLEEMRAALAHIEAQLGPVNGVIHTAGVLDDALILTKEADAAARVLAPKVKGTLVLDAVLRDRPLDFFLLFSSRSAVSGVVGQVDYAAANAFLDAFAHARTAMTGQPTTAVGWSAWQEVGMVAELLRASGASESSTTPVHPLLDRRITAAAEDTFATEFSIGRSWVLDDHRIRDGDALIPGTGYLELVRAAYEETPREGAVELSDVFFISPFMVRPGESKELNVTLRPNADGQEFVIRGRASGFDWQDHVTGHVASRPQEAPARHDIKALLARCAVREDVFTTRQREHLELGPRWENLKRIGYGNGEALARIELPAEFADELDTYRLHPAILDVATACAQPLIPGFSPEEHFYVPASYTRLVMHETLPRCIYSYIRHRSAESDGEMAVFDITILDDAGHELVEITEFVMMRVADRASLGHTQEPVPGRAAESGTQTEPRLVVDLEDAILPAEGMDAIDRVLAASYLPQVIVSPQDLNRWFAHLRRMAAPPAPAVQPARQRAVENVPATEAVLREHEAVREAVVLAQKDRQGTRLVAYVVYQPDEFSTVSDLRRFLRSRLPEDQVPQNFVELDELPARSDGSPDIAALPDPFAADDDHVAPRTPAEKAIAEIWAELLGVERVSVHDNFLDIGGHSLLALRAINKVAKKLGVRLSPSALNLQTLEQIAAGCETKEAAAPAAVAAAPAANAAAQPAAPGRTMGSKLFNAVKQTITRN